MRKIRFIGDVHGKFDRYKKVIKDCKESIQVGDMGVGFVNPKLTDALGVNVYRANPPYDHMTRDGNNHRFIRGNHDNPSACATQKQYIRDGKYEEDINAMFIGGAYSIDQAWRTRNIDYWDDEELSYEALDGMIGQYDHIRPKVMITHECPEDVAHVLFGVNGQLKFNIPSRTRNAFQTMLDIHQPDLWIFGHWHTSKNEIVKGYKTRFICLAELEHIDLVWENNVLKTF